jgi:hypothetical protein
MSEAIAVVEVAARAGTCAVNGRVVLLSDQTPFQ